MEKKALMEKEALSKLLLFLMYYLLFQVNTIILIPQIEYIGLLTFGHIINALIFIRVFLLGLELGCRLSLNKVRNDLENEDYLVIEND